MIVQMEQAEAANLDSGYVMEKMDDSTRHGFLAGIAEGIAYSRFLRDKPNEESMLCVQNWFYNGTDEEQKDMLRLLTKHKKLPPAVIVYTALKKKCGE